MKNIKNGYTKFEDELDEVLPKLNDDCTKYEHQYLKILMKALKKTLKKKETSKPKLKERCVTLGFINHELTRTCLNLTTTC
ncbi:hypothetical protein PCK1_000445 [Pneumocystis canis]|nr:hypothetical protein PCK1_000445 [Pneumocystis canis]